MESELVYQFEDKKSCMNTYCYGPILKFKKDMTRRQLMEACQKISDRFGNAYIFFPDKITDGGIKMEPANEELIEHFEYKSMRFQAKDWPWISNLDEWNHDETILFKNGNVLNTFLRSTRAPAWTLNEVSKICNVLETYGVKINMNLPSTFFEQAQK